MFNYTIYRHRDKYTTTSIYIHSPLVKLDQVIVSKFWDYATQRMSIRHLRQQGLPAPRTQDLILQRYKFCNVYRELGKQTIMIHTALGHLRDDFQGRLLQLMIARFISNIQTLEYLRASTGGDITQYESVLRSITGTKYGDAYLFPPQVPVMLGYTDRADFICNYLPKVVGSIAELIMSFDDESVANGVAKITEFLGVGLKFHFTEVLIDVAYQYPHLINLNKQFPIGPGSSPTMKSLNPKTNQEEIYLSLIATQPHDFPYLQINGRQMPITAEGIEGLGCEFRKYNNLMQGKGKSRLYKSK